MAIAPSVTSTTWLYYTEDKKKGKLLLPHLVKHRDLVRRLLALKDTLCFKESDLKEALASARQKNSATWAGELRGHEEDNWDE
eukprot:7077488-Lingulodinium_polyedra.AAC.1